MNFKTIFLILTILLQPVVVSQVSAASGATISESEAAVIASKATGGQVISSETDGTAGVTVYLFKVLMSDGRVKHIKVNAKNGEIL